MLAHSRAVTFNSDALSRAKLAAYGLPGLPLAILLLPVFVYLPTFYAQDLGLGFATVGIVLFIARLWDVLTDPVIGALSDHYKMRLGRRRPWMIAGTPLVVISATFLLMPQGGVDWTYLLVWTFALYLGGTMILLPYNAWGAELSDDYHERSRIAAWREGLVIVGILLATGLPALLKSSEGEALRLLAWLLIILLPLSVLLASVFVPEMPKRSLAAPALTGSWRLIAANRPFRCLIAAYFLNGISNGLPATLFLLFVTHRLQQPDWSGIFLFVYFACGVMAVPIWLAVTRRLGKHKTWIAAMLIACATFALVPLLGAGDVIPFLFICVVTGFCLGADLILPPSMQADVIDLDRRDSRSERAGTFFALWGIATKLALALAVGLAFPVLETAGFSASGSNSEKSLFILAALYSLVPIAFKLAAIYLMSGYPVTAEHQRHLLEEIERGRREDMGTQHQ